MSNDRKKSIEEEEKSKFRPKDGTADDQPDMKGDRLNMFLLFFLYMLQNIPVGIIMAMPLFLQKRGASYEAQALISFCRWPTAMKLLWAPIVDACYSTRFGRRKSWIVPTKLLVCVLLLLLSLYIEDLLGSKEHPANMAILFPLLFTLSLLINIEDVAMDAWAITILKRRNIGYAPICTSLGASVAMVLGYTALVTLESADFCNSWLRSTPQNQGLITLSG